MEGMGNYMVEESQSEGDLELFTQVPKRQYWDCTLCLYGLEGISFDEDFVKNTAYEFLCVFFP